MKYKFNPLTNLEAGGLKQLNAYLDDLYQSKASSEPGASGNLASWGEGGTIGDSGIPVPGAWKDWTPTLTNITKGAGGTVVAKYCEFGKSVLFEFIFTFGTGSAISGDCSFTLPVVRTRNDTMNVFCLLLDSSVARRVIGTGIMNATTCWSRVIDTATAYAFATGISSSIPFTWANGDQIVVRGSYEAA